MAAFDRDKLSMVPRDEAIQSAYGALSAIQREQPHVMVAAAAALFAAVCARTGIDPADAHSLGVKLLRDQTHHVKGNITVEAMRDFAGLRIMGDRNVSYM